MYAFPWEEIERRPDGNVLYAQHPGMTLRQWYAGLAMQGLLANPETGTNWQAIVIAALNMADALIAAEKESKP